MSDQPQPSTMYPLLQAIVAARGMTLKAIYTNRDAAEIFAVSVRTVQDWIREEKLTCRDLPGRGRHLAEDLETFLQQSKRKPTGGQRG
jgi:transposase